MKSNCTENWCMLTFYNACMRQGKNFDHIWLLCLNVYKESADVQVNASQKKNYSDLPTAFWSCLEFQLRQTVAVSEVDACLSSSSFSFYFLSKPRLHLKWLMCSFLCTWKRRSRPAYCFWCNFNSEIIIMLYLVQIIFRNIPSGYVWCLL